MEKYEKCGEKLLYKRHSITLLEHEDFNHRKPVTHTFPLLYSSMSFVLTVTFIKC